MKSTITKEIKMTDLIDATARGRFSAIAHILETCDYSQDELEEAILVAAKMEKHTDNYDLDGIHRTAEIYELLTSHRE